MTPPFEIALKSGWAVLLGYWTVSGLRAKRASRAQSRGAEWLKYWLPLGLACVLIGPGHWFESLPWLKRHFLPESSILAWAGLIVAYAGFALAIWSRAVLGRNWSAVVQLKQDHELIESGPYRRLRHPIYTGLLLGFIGTALMIDELRGLLAVAIVFVSFWRKLKLEERWLQELFGEHYVRYRQRTRALIPGLL
ncbi:isoprenylcysteine carboxyl methyltransferase [Pseudoxanthomonas kalamensis DSM 18571]|uniref:methyltransferase family protein n=1 Tax=Pseudoxanthomonas kalamensis TaxID=289483 RepID=UPI001391AD19|nr:isoprenylcysteine carboxylmethyltransferase family protein [Pseudoxanthomonas kalamensis]KAF1710701.1 isoprenylcysteine carboxyl methyltransferase [Pseudoxanthomonas kalamensis DSM 18571]